MKRFFSKENKALLSELVRTDFKLRYQGSVLGYAWSLLRPLFMFAILYIVFVRFIPLGKDVPHYPAYLLLGIVLWNFFVELTSQGLGSIVGRGDLIRKISIPRWMIIFSSSVSALINLSLNLLVLAIFLVINGVNPGLNLLWLPVYVVEIYILAAGLALFLSAAFVKYRDIGYIWEVAVQAGFYVSAIIYPLTKIEGEVYRKLILLNPIAQAIQDTRDKLITNQSLTASDVFNGGFYMFIPFFIVVVIFLIGAWYFRKQQKYFAENI